MRVSVFRYGLAVAAVVLAAAVVGLGFPARARLSVWAGAGLALGVEAICFAALVRGVRRGGSSFLGAWAGGILLRFAALLVAQAWAVGALGLEPAPALFTMAGALFLLALLEAVALRPVGRAEAAHA